MTSVIGVGAGGLVFYTTFEVGVINFHCFHYLERFFLSSSILWRRNVHNISDPEINPFDLGSFRYKSRNQKLEGLPSIRSIPMAVLLENQQIYSNVVLQPVEFGRGEGKRYTNCCVNLKMWPFKIYPHIFPSYSKIWMWVEGNDKFLSNIRLLCIVLRSTYCSYCNWRCTNVKIGVHVIQSHAFYDGVHASDAV